MEIIKYIVVILLLTSCDTVEMHEHHVQDCVELGKKLSTETKFIDGYCWVKNYSRSSNYPAE